MRSAGQHTIRKLTLHTHAADPYQERYSLERLLQDTTLSLPGFPRRGRLLIRRLAMPFSRQNLSWHHHFQNRIHDLWQKAARPRAGWVPWDAEAVFFEHEEVYLQCCIQAHPESPWWNTQTPAELVEQHVQVLPVVLMNLEMGVVYRWLSDLPPVVLAEAVRHLASHHLLSELPVTLEDLSRLTPEAKNTVLKSVFALEKPSDRSILKVLDLLPGIVHAPPSNPADRVQMSALVLLLLATPQLRNQARHLISTTQKALALSTAQPVQKVEKPQFSDQDGPVLNQFHLPVPPLKRRRSKSQKPAPVQNPVSGDLEPPPEEFQMLTPAEDQNASVPDVAFEDAAQIISEHRDPLNPVLSAEPLHIEKVQSKYAGLLFLCNLFLHLDLITDFSDLSRRTHSPWALLGRVGLMAFADFRDDPLWTLCHTREDRPASWTPRIHLPSVLPSSWTSLLPEANHWKLDTTRYTTQFAVQHPCGVWIATGNEHAFRKWHPHAPLSMEPLAPHPDQATRFFEFLQAVLQDALNTAEPFGLLCQSPGLLEATAAQLDVTFSLEQHPIEIRMLGLDRDPGWLPQAGLGLHFHFEVDR